VKDTNCCVYIYLYYLSVRKLYTFRAISSCTFNVLPTIEASMYVARCRCHGPLICRFSGAVDVLSVTRHSFHFTRSCPDREIYELDRRRHGPILRGHNTRHTATSHGRGIAVMRHGRVADTQRSRRLSLIRIWREAKRQQPTEDHSNEETAING
jgi:hypothetical protein